MLLCECNDTASDCCSVGVAVGACSPWLCDPPIYGRENEKSSLPYAWAPLEGRVRSLLISPSSLDNEKKREEERKKATVVVS